MATEVKAPAEEVTAPPDVRGPTEPLPAGILAAGVISIAAVLAGLVAVQTGYAVNGGNITPACREELVRGVEQELVEGALGVCHIVEGLRSGSQTALLIIGAMAGIVAVAGGFGSYKRMPSKRMREQCISGAVLGIQGIALAGLIHLFRSSDQVFIFARNFLNIVVLEGSFGAFVRGAKNTLVLAFGGELGGIVVGLLLALLVISNRRVVRAPARTYVNFFRGTPLIWQLAFFYFLLRLGVGLDIAGFTTAVLVFGLNTGAYAAEVFRAGIQSIERGQIEAARSLGMSYGQAMRYAIVPQAFRRVIPPLMNEFVILIKDTSLVLILGLASGELELYTTAREGYSDTFNASFYTAAAAGYLVVTLPLIGAVNAVERRLRSGLVTVTT